MNIRHSLTALTIVMGSLTAAAAPALADGFDNHRGPRPLPVAVPVAARPIAAPVAQPQFVPPQYAARRASEAFVAQTRARIAQISQQLRFAVSQGRVRPQALSALNGESTRIEFAMRRASRDGIIVRPEQFRISSMVDGLTRLDDQFRTPMYGHGRGRFGSRY